MLRALGPITAFALMATVVACSGRDPVADGANNVAGLPAVSANAPSPPDGSPPANASAPAVAAGPSSRIPAALQGRWGLTPGDCTSGADAQADGDSISGTFDFTGEGQSWSKFEALKLQGRDLVRTETKPAASFTYAKCT